MQPVFYYDLVSPYAALAAHRIERVLPVAPVWQPIWAAPVFAAAGRQSVPSLPERAARREEIEGRAARYGMPSWRWPSAYPPPDVPEAESWLPPNTLALMRLATYAQQAGVGDEFARRAFRLAFGEGRDIWSVDDAVIAAAVACGLDADEARAATTTPEIKQALRAATEAAIRIGVKSVPTVAVDDEIFWGDDRLEDAAAALVRARSARRS